MPFPEIPRLLKTRIRLTPSAWVLIAANAVPLFGIFCLGWELFPLVLVYWLENGVVGIFTVLKMLTTCTSLSPDVTNASTWWMRSGYLRFNWSILILVLFFLFHYGVFWMGHGSFVIGLFGSSNGLTSTYQIILKNGLQYTLLALVLSHGFSYLHNFIGHGEYRTASAPELMFSPYRRVVVLHIFILLGGFVIMTVGVTRVGLLILAVVKVVADLQGHSYERSTSGMKGAAGKEAY